MSTVFERAAEIFKIFAYLKSKKAAFAFVIIGIFCLSAPFLTSSISSFLGYGQSAHESINRKELYEMLKRQPKRRLKKMRKAGLKALAWIHLLEKESSSLDKALRKPGQLPRRYVHFPKQEDVFDEMSSSLYYYHTHRSDEKGHFHLFLMEEGMQSGLKPMFASSREEGFSHLIAISVDEKGRPFRLFTTNQWVTQENWYKAQDVICFAQKFHVKGNNRDWATSQCLNSLITLFGPQIEELVFKRNDEVTKLAHQKGVSEQAILEDAQIETLSEMLIDIDLQLELLQKLV